MPASSLADFYAKFNADRSNAGLGASTGTSRVTQQGPSFTAMGGMGVTPSVQAPAQQTSPGAVGSLWSGLGALGGGIASALGVNPNTRSAAAPTTTQTPPDTTQSAPDQGAYMSALSQLWTPRDQFNYDFAQQKYAQGVAGNTVAPPNMSMDNGMISGGGFSLPMYQMPNVQTPADRTPQIQAAYQGAANVLQGMLGLIGDKSATARQQIELEFQKSGGDLARMIARAKEEYQRLGGQLTSDATAAIDDATKRVNDAVSQAGIAKANEDTRYSDAKTGLDEAAQEGTINLRGELARRGIGNSSQAITQEGNNLRDILRGKRMLEGEHLAREAQIDQNLTDVKYNGAREITRLQQQLSRGAAQVTAAYQDRIATLEADQTMAPEKKALAIQELTNQTNTLLAQLGQQQAQLGIQAEQAIGGAQQQRFANETQIASLQNGINSQNIGLFMQILQTGYGFSKDQAQQKADALKVQYEAAQDKRAFAEKIAAAAAGDQRAADALDLQREKANTTATHYQNMDKTAAERVAQAKEKTGGAISPSDTKWADSLISAKDADTMTVAQIMQQIMLRKTGGANAAKERAALVDYFNEAMFDGQPIIPQLPDTGSVQGLNEWMNSLSPDERTKFAENRSTLRYGG